MWIYVKHPRFRNPDLQRSSKINEKSQSHYQAHSIKLSLLRDEGCAYSSQTKNIKQIFKSQTKLTILFGDVVFVMKTKNTWDCGLLNSMSIRCLQRTE